MSSRAAADVRDRQTANIANQAIHPRFFKGDKRIVVDIVDLRPAVVAFSGRQQINRVGWQSGSFLGHGYYRFPLRNIRTKFICLNSCPRSLKLAAFLCLVS